MRVPAAPRRARHPARAAVPGGPRAGRRRDGLLLGRRARLLAGPRRLHDRGRLRRRLHAEPDLRGGLLGRTGHTEAVLVVFDPQGHELRPRSCACSGRATTRRRACARATTSARSTARRSTTSTSPSSAPPPRRTPRRVPGAPARRPATARSRPRSPTAGDVLLRRAVPPAVPREEPERLLRPRRHGRLLPGRRRRVACLTPARLGA